MTTAADDEVAITREGALARITLNRPKSINALSRAMIDAITDVLAVCAADPTIRLVVFTGNGPRGFCAGGDVRAIRQMVLEGRLAEADAYFAAEYAMNGIIARFPKPTVALAHGATMGGGIGIAGHCRYRFCRPDTRFAMPESAIGFVCDIGVNAIVCEAPVERALPFLLSGVPIGPADALALGLADGVIAAESEEALLAALVEATGAPDVDLAVVQLFDRFGVPAGDAPFLALCDQVPELDVGSVATIIAGFDNLPNAAGAALAQTLRSRSPLSLEAIRRAHLYARAHGAIGEVLAVDLALARFMARQPDFVEGVRAVLVDKDQTPVWAPLDADSSPLIGLAEAIDDVSEFTASAP